MYRPNYERQGVSALFFHTLLIMTRICAVFFMLLTLSGVLNAQDLLSDRKEEVELTKKALDHIYGFEFEEAKATIAKLDKIIPAHPGLTLLEALAIYWQEYPLKAGSKARSEYEAALNKTAERADAMLERSKNDVEGIFFTLAAYGFLTGYYAEEGSIFKALGFARKAYSSLKAGFDLKDEFDEFYFSTGLYNYYREKYPENNAGYKSVAWLFQSGDKELGIRQLQTASRQALFTKVEADYYLFHIYLRYESDPQSALTYAQRLARTYPQNLTFAGYYAENLLAVGRFAEGDRLANRLMESSKTYYRLPGHVLHAIALEKSKNKLDEAAVHYEKALELSESAQFDADHYRSMAFLGLGRIAATRGNHKLAVEWHDKALKTARYDITINEAKKFLNK